MPRTGSAASLSRDLPRGVKTRLSRAAAYAKKHLYGIRRRNGQAYAEHCIQVAATLREAIDDPVILLVASLHDIPVHPDGAALLKDAPLTSEERSLVERMHTLRRLNIDASTDDLDTVIDAFLEEPKLLPLRMAHRLNDVRQLRRFPQPIRKHIAHETLHMYAAIAGRLGMHRWRTEMEDICFPFLQPKIARTLRNKFDACKKIDDACMLHTRNFLVKKLKSSGLACETEMRRKGMYSTYRKMIIKDRTFEDLTDRLAIRIIVGSVADCYRALGIIHAAMHPIPGKLKDYIGAPKENGYQSIHSVVYPLPGVTEQPIEIQIRARDMHHACEFGTAAHGQYKESVYALQSQTSRVNLFRNLESLREESRDPKQFEQALRKYFREDHIAVFDARNNLFHFRKPASVLDFVCHVYPSRFHLLKEVFLNGRRRTPDTRLEDGDTVDAVFGRSPRIAKEWMYACCHPAHIRAVKERCLKIATKG